jgi:hypothetical protein
LIVTVSYDTMTNMTSTQTTLDRPRDDRLDAIMPPPIKTSRMLLIVAAICLVATAAFLGRWEGAYSPQFALGLSSAGYDESPHHLEFDFSLSSGRRFPVTVTGIRATAPGLPRPLVTYSTSSGGSLSAPFVLHAGQVVNVKLLWRTYDCSSVHPGESRHIAIDFKNAVDLNGTDEVGAMVWAPNDPQYSGISPASPSLSQGVGWAAGVTWIVCGHPGSSLSLYGTN